MQNAFIKLIYYIFFYVKYKFVLLLYNMVLCEYQQCLNEWNLNFYKPRILHFNFPFLWWPPWHSNPPSRELPWEPPPPTPLPPPPSITVALAALLAMHSPLVKTIQGEANPGKKWSKTRPAQLTYVELFSSSKWWWWHFLLVHWLQRTRNERWESRNQKEIRVFTNQWRSVCKPN